MGHGGARRGQVTGDHSSRVVIDDREPASFPADVNDGLTLWVHARQAISTVMGVRFTFRRGSSLGSWRGDTT